MQGSNQKKILFIFIIFITITHLYCTSKSVDSSSNTCDPTISFSKTIKPILDANCNMTGCHDDQVITALKDYQTVHDGAAQIKLSIVTGKMPKNRTITTSEKNAIFCWIDNGAKNN
ncbi:MAG: hypothetical protein EBV82_04415 [Chitinophagia bacterium]|jgi:hypothetical protein|nr:hypothetical protein [Chitinophagia bacterium]